jgi:hypothetical protein
MKTPVTRAENDDDLPVREVEGARGGGGRRALGDAYEKGEEAGHRLPVNQEMPVLARRVGNEIA